MVKTDGIRYFIKCGYVIFVSKHFIFKSSYLLISCDGYIVKDIVTIVSRGDFYERYVFHRGACRIPEHLQANLDFLRQNRPVSARLRGSEQQIPLLHRPANRLSGHHFDYERAGFFPKRNSGAHEKLHHRQLPGHPAETAFRHRPADQTPAAGPASAGASL